MNLFTSGRLTSLFLLLILSTMVGCVGTVQNAQVPSTKISANPLGEISFNGIFQAIPISHDKIEVFFYPASGGSEKFDYIFQVGENPVPVAVPSDILLPDYRGLLKYTLTGLDRGRKYFLKLEAYDQKGDGKSSNNSTKTVRTFEHIVADFRGISTVSNAPGVDGLDSIKVRWSHAKVKYDTFGQPYEGNPNYYEVIVVDSTRHNPSSLDNRLITSSQGRWVKIVDYDALVNETMVNGLPSNTKFYIRVRAIHEGSIDDATDKTKRGELNSDYLAISTLNSDLSSIEFKNFKTKKNSGIFQTNSLLLSWSPVTGVFEHLRVYWVNENGRNQVENPGIILDPSTSGSCTFANNQNNFSCKKMSSNLANTVVANLDPSTSYYFRLVACQDSECSRYALSDVISGDTFPVLASFSGISGIKSAQNVSEIGSFTLTYPLPDLSEGFFDGFVIGFKETIEDTSFYKLSEGEALPSGLNLGVEAYEYDESGKVIITGVDYSDPSRNYCFTIYPYVIKADNTRDTETYKAGYPWVCGRPELLGPRITSFIGIDSASTSSSLMQIDWSTPVNGIYSKYELFIKKPGTPSIFNFATAINQFKAWLNDPTAPFDYQRVLVDGSENSVLVPYMANGTYDIGVLTYHAYGNAPVRSELNTQIFRCVVNSARVDAGGFPLPADCIRLD